MCMETLGLPFQKILQNKSLRKKHVRLQAADGKFLLQMREMCETFETYHWAQEHTITQTKTDPTITLPSSKAGSFS